ncbi:MFS transporter [Bacillus clarus]|uniref:MFS transporter n=1 Tax=Bacillus clarus TaxID=2338372 RepID=A0A090Z4F9_9BACI|nr:MFS transporter [Bacillus clarus]KFM99290.1 sugar (and other) transporter family protein [Bacillus clarus]RFT67188.1 MFS transporter [Bacillus clarus]
MEISKEMNSVRNYTVMTAVLCWAGMVVMSSLYVTIPLIALFSEFFQVSLTKSAATGSIFSFGFAIGCLLFGAISDKYGRKKVIFIGLLVLSVVSFLLGLVDSLFWLVILRGLQGIAAATFSPVALAYVVEMFPAERKITTIGFVSTGFLVAGIVGQVMSTVVSQYFGWHMVFFLLSIVYIITALWIHYSLPKGEPSQSYTDILGPIKQMGKVFTHKSLVLSYMIAFVLLMAFVNMYTVLGNYLSSPNYNLNAEQILYFRLAGLFGMLLSPLAGRLTKRFEVQQVLRGGLLVAIFSLSSLGFVSNLPLLVIMSVCFVIGIALSIPSLVTLVGQLGGKARGIAVSIYTFILFLGTSIGPVISIYLMKIGDYAQTFILLGLILFIGFVASLFINNESTFDKA